MSRKSGIGSIGMLLALIGSLIMIILGILLIISNVLNDFNSLINQLNIRVIDLSNTGGDVVISGILTILFGVIVLWSWRDNKVGDSLLVWGIVYIVLWLVLGGGLGGLLVFIAGILLLIDYFT